MIQAPTTQYIPAQMPIQPVYSQPGANNPYQYSQAPGYFYNYPTASYYNQTPQTGKSQFNGVNIEIINPQGQGYVPGTPISMPVQQPVYTQAPVYQPLVYPQPQAVQQIPVPVPVAPQTPEIPAPMPQQIPAAVPASQVVQQVPQAQIPAPVQQMPAPAQQVPAAAPVIEQPVTTQQSSVSPESFAGKLKTTNLDDQKAALEELATYIKSEGKEGNELLDSVVFDALVDIINKDTSNLQGPSEEVKELRNKNIEDLTPEEKTLAETPCEMEKAQMNKQYALYTISFMQERLNNELKQTLPLQDLPCIETVINSIKSDPDPQIRLAGISSLVHIAKPEYKEYLSTIFELAQADEDERVKEAAVKASENLKSI